jgi:hypothetical protein
MAGEIRILVENILVQSTLLMLLEPGKEPGAGYKIDTRRNQQDQHDRTGRS